MSGWTKVRDVWTVLYVYEDEKRDQCRYSAKAAKKLVRHLETLPHVTDINVLRHSIRASEPAAVGWHPGDFPSPIDTQESQ